MNEFVNCIDVVILFSVQKEGRTFDNALDLWTALNLGDTLYGNGMEYVNEVCSH